MVRLRSLKNIATVMILTLCLFSFAGCEQIGSYEGRSAQEWFNEYDRSDAENSQLKAKISDLESENDDLQNQNDDLESEKSDLEDQAQESEDKYESLKNCVFMEDEDAHDCYYRY